MTSQRNVRDLDEKTAERFLDMAKSRKPVQELVECAEDLEAEALFRLVRAEWERRGSNPAALWEQADPDVKALREIKTSGRRLFKDRPAGDDARIAGLAAYFVSIAVALDRHGVLISSADPDDVLEALRALSKALPSPWGDHCRRGLATLERLP